ncbi:hypothetical protein BGZ76_003466 [Entomortierella beljakovae]|nr:hypothetical protein BGZ76_003466 [Entomortierella beljakovae]
MTNINPFNNAGLEFYFDTALASRTQFASTEAGNLPEVIQIILQFIPLHSLYACALVNRCWRRETEKSIGSDVFKLLFRVYSGWPAIYTLNTVTLQYPPEDCITHSRPDSYQFVLSCQTQSGGIESFGGDLSSSLDTASQTHAHHNHAYYPAEEYGDFSRSADNRASPAIANVVYRTNSSSTLPPQSTRSNTNRSASFSSTSPSPESYQQTNRIPERQQNYQTAGRTLQQISPRSQISQSRSSQLSRLNTFSNLEHRSAMPGTSNEFPITKLVPCPFDPSSDSSYSNEDSPPLVSKPMWDNPEGSTSNLLGESLAISPEGQGFSGSRIEHTEDTKNLSGLDDIFHHQLQVGGTSSQSQVSFLHNEQRRADNLKSPQGRHHDEHQGMDYIEPMEHVPESPYSATTLSPEAQFRRNDQQDQEMSEQPKRPRRRPNPSNPRSRNSSSSSKRQSTSSKSDKPRRRRGWGMMIEAYRGRRSAQHAMILASRRLMDSSDGCTILENTETTQIVWNDITRTETIWSIAPMYLETSDQDYDDYDAEDY